MEYCLPVGRQGIMEYWDLTHHSIIPNFQCPIFSLSKTDSSITPLFHYFHLSRLCKFVIFCVNFSWIILF